MWHKVVAEHHESEAKRIVADELPPTFTEAVETVDSDETLIRRLMAAIPRDTGREKRFMARVLRRRG